MAPLVSVITEIRTNHEILTLSRGCTTPKVIEHIVEAWESMCDSEDKDYNLLDGYEDLPEEYQEKVRKALEQGHVDDADWKGVSPTIPYRSGIL